MPDFVAAAFTDKKRSQVQNRDPERERERAMIERRMGSAIEQAQRERYRAAYNERELRGPTLLDAQQSMGWRERSVAGRRRVAELATERDARLDRLNPDQRPRVIDRIARALETMFGER